MKQSRPTVLPFYVIIFSGIAVTCFQFLYDRSLWIDEVSLALNIASRSYAELLHPLEYFQAAPIVFLFIEKAFTDLFGINEYALRAFPFICYIASIYLIHRLAFGISENKHVAFFSAAIFSVSYFMIYYATEVKQYMTDIAVILILYNFILSFRQNKFSDLVGLAVFGVVAMFSSTISVIPLFLIGTYLLYKGITQKKHTSALLVPVSWLIFLAINYVIFIHDHPTAEIMRTHWQSKFLPTDIFSNAFYEFLIYAIGTSFRRIVDVDFYWSIALISALYGIYILLCRKKYWWLYFLIVPALIHLMLSALELYPYYGRFILYLSPLLIIMMSIGWVSACNKLAYASVRWMALLLPFLFFFYSLMGDIPIEKEEIKMSLNFVRDNIQPQHKIYVYYGAERAYKFYTQFGEFDQLPIAVMGKNGRKNPQIYDADMETLNGLVWLVFAHVKGFDSQSTNEEEYIMSWVNRESGKPLLSYECTGSSVYLVSFENKLE